MFWCRHFEAILLLDLLTATLKSVRPSHIERFFKSTAWPDQRPGSSTTSAATPIVSKKRIGSFVGCSGMCSATETVATRTGEQLLQAQNDQGATSRQVCRRSRRRPPHAVSSLICFDGGTPGDAVWLTTISGAASTQSAHRQSYYWDPVRGTWCSR